MIGSDSAPESGTDDEEEEHAPRRKSRQHDSGDEDSSDDASESDIDTSDPDSDSDSDSDSVPLHPLHHARRNAKPPHHPLLAPPKSRRSRPPLQPSSPRSQLASLLAAPTTNGPDAEADLADRDLSELKSGTTKKERKNRMGQRARKALAEKKYGKNANHIKLREKQKADKAERSTYPRRLPSSGAGAAAGGVVGGRQRPPAFVAPKKVDGGWGGKVAPLPKQPKRPFVLRCSSQRWRQAYAIGNTWCSRGRRQASSSGRKVTGMHPLGSQSRSKKSSWHSQARRKRRSFSTNRISHTHMATSPQELNVSHRHQA